MKQIFVVLVSAIFLTACAGNSSESPKDATSEASTQADGYTTLSKHDLQAAILPVNELPTGYGTDPDADESESANTYCDYKPPFKAATYAEGNFVKGGGLTAEALFIGMRQFDNSKQSAASFEALVDIMKTCKKSSIDGEKVTFSVLSTPDLEDGSIGISTNTDDFSVPQFFALAGPTLIAVGGGGLMSTDIDMLIETLKKQIGAYKGAA